MKSYTERKGEKEGGNWKRGKGRQGEAKGGVEGKGGDEKVSKCCQKSLLE